MTAQKNIFKKQELEDELIQFGKDYLKNLASLKEYLIQLPVYE